MSWDSAAQWIAIGFTAGGAVGSWRRTRAANRTAIAADERAKEALDAQKGMHAAQNKIAEALDRLSGDSPTTSGVEFLIEHHGGATFVLRNLGPETATGVTIETDHEMAIDLPVDVTLLRLAGHRFGLQQRWGLMRPTEVEVRCDQWESPRMVPVPYVPKGG